MVKPRILRRKAESKRRPVNKILEGITEPDIEVKIKQEPIDPDPVKLNTEVEIKPEIIKEEAIKKEIKIEEETDLEPEFKYYPFDTEDDIEDDEPEDPSISVNPLQCVFHDHSYAEPPSLIPITWVKCELCLYKAKSVYGLQGHLLRSHKRTDQKTLWMNCSYCDFKTDKLSLIKRHLVKEHGNKTEFQKWYECELCKYKSKRRYDFTLHMYNKHTSPDKLLWASCPICSYKGKTMRVLKGHIMRKHRSHFNTFFS